MRRQCAASKKARELVPGCKCSAGGLRASGRRVRHGISQRMDIDDQPLWGFIGMKQKTARRTNQTATAGDIWTWVAIDPDTKLVPTFAIGDRTQYMANCFIEDLAAHLSHRIQISSDALKAYQGAIERAFGSEVDYGSLSKPLAIPSLRSNAGILPPEVVKVERAIVQGTPDVDLISTSHVENQNHTLRMHCRRLSRLTNAFSKKLENFKAAVALHYAYYNFVKTHQTIRCTPAMEAGVTDSAWTITDLVGMVEA